jgi:hypothetical protein
MTLLYSDTAMPGDVNDPDRTIEFFATLLSFTPPTSLSFGIQEKRLCPSL